MIFGKIEYINLLPFQTFLKRYIQSSQTKAIINYKKSYPSLINKQFKKRKIDAAFISSIYSKNAKNLDLGIVAKNEICSVLCLDGTYTIDSESSTSNILALVLQLQGKIIIGDKALKYYYDNKNTNYTDLALAWKKKYNLPFVFARLCYNSNEILLKKLAKKFIQKKTKIPQYILKKESKKSGVSVNNILKYLDNIEYKISAKEKKSLKLFFKLSKNISKQEENKNDYI